MSTHALPQPQMFDGSRMPPQPTPGAATAAPSTHAAGTPQSYVDREPIITAATVIGLLSALVSWAVSRNLLGEADETFLLAVIPVVSAVAFAYYGRHGVTSVGRAQMAIDDAYTAQPGLDPKPTI